MRKKWTAKKAQTHKKLQIKLRETDADDAGDSSRGKNTNIYIFKQVYTDIYVYVFCMSPNLYLFVSLLFPVFLCTFLWRFGIIAWLKSNKRREEGWRNGLRGGCGCPAEVEPGIKSMMHKTTSSSSANNETGGNLRQLRNARPEMPFKKKWS